MDISSDTGVIKLGNIQSIA